MSTVLDLFIQDFITTNKLLNQHVAWSTLARRHFVESGAPIKVFSFQSGAKEHFAVGRTLELPDGDCFRIEMTHPEARAEEVTGHRLDCLRMTHTDTHTGLDIAKGGADTVLIRLRTRNRGLIGIVFVIRDNQGVVNPVLV
jgi:hypothetical protein